MERLPYLFILCVGALCLATFFTSSTLAAEPATPCEKPMSELVL